MDKLELGIIGGGNMAEAVLGGMIGGGIVRASDVVVSDPDPARRQAMSRIGVAVASENRAAATRICILLAVKPQVMAEVLDEIAQTVASQAVVISIAAGITTSFIDERLGGAGRIVRVMPNTPMLVGAGMSAITAGPRATDDDVQLAQRIFACGGKVVVVPERMMDAVTAVSGSGPAYLFYLIEAMIDAGVAEGLEAETAVTLAVQTCAGAVELLKKTDQSPQQLRARVTSPGGTTQRAIESLDSSGVKESLITAIHAAAARSRELG